jgi:pimeloyl-ACP methyl ester carboxylesterase
VLGEALLIIFEPGDRPEGTGIRDVHEAVVRAPFPAEVLACFRREASCCREPGATWLWHRPADPVAAIRGFVTGWYAEFRSVRGGLMGLHHIEHGTGVPVVALHGWTADHRLMLGCLEPVFAGRPGFRRIYVDLPGMGRSAAPPSIASADDVLAAVLAFLDSTLGDEPFLLVGESYGGYLSRAVTAARHGRVLGLALICPVGAVVDRTRRTLPARQVLRPDPAVVAGLDGRTAAAFTEMAVVQSPEAAAGFRDHVMPGLDLADAEAVDRIERRWELTVAPESSDPFPRPTLILTGRQDHVVGYADQFALLPHYPRATFAVVDVAGHNLQLDQPALFRTLMHDWLDRVAA